MIPEEQKRKKHTISEMDRMRDLCYESLISDILSSNMKIGAILPGERILSERYHVSLRAIRSTIVRMQKENILLNEQRKGMRLVAQPQRPRSMMNKKFALFADQDDENPRSQFNSPSVICSWMDRQINEQGGTLEFINLRNIPDIEHFSTIIDSQKYSGFLYMGAEQEPIRLLTESGIPSIVIGWNTSSLDNICFDDLQIGNTMASHMLEYGHERAVIFKFPEFPWSEERCKAIQMEYMHRNKPIPDVFEFVFNDINPVAGIKDVLEKISPDVTGIFCVNDWLAVQVLKESVKLNIPIPERFSLIGADDKKEQRCHNLTTIQLSDIELGICAYERLKEKILSDRPSLKPERITPFCPLIKRLTTRSIAERKKFISI